MPTADIYRNKPQGPVSGLFTVFGFDNYPANDTPLDVALCQLQPFAKFGQWPHDVLQYLLVPVSGPQPDEITIVLCGSDGLLVASRNTPFAREVAKLACQGRQPGEKLKPENDWAYT